MVTAMAMCLALSSSSPPAEPPAAETRPAQAETQSRERPAPTQAVAFRWENDVLAGRDEQYSNGLSLSLSRVGRGPLGWIWNRAAGSARRVTGYEIGQLTVTPGDISRTVPDAADRPYAGLLYGAVSTHLIRGETIDAVRVVSGVVGPASGAAQVQRAVHTVIASPIPRGWGSQLRNEPILNGVYERRRRYWTGTRHDAWSLQVVRVTGVMLGNVLTQAHAGAQVRLGRNLRDDFGSSLIRGVGSIPATMAPGAPLRRGGFGVFVAGGGTAVARNLSLDGNTFGDGPRVRKRPGFVAGEAGVSLWTSRLEFALSLVYWGREYEAQPRGARFGALTVAVRP